MNRPKTIKTSNMTRSLICIDSRQGEELKGRVYCPYLRGAAPFECIWEMILVIERLLDAFAFPEPSFQFRSFKEQQGCQCGSNSNKEVERYMSDDIFTENAGQKATFVVQVQFRQNASWQGTIQWLDQKKTLKFRSTLEMLKLMDEAVCAEKESAQASGWQDNGGE